MITEVAPALPSGPPLHVERFGDDVERPRAGDKLPPLRGRLHLARTLLVIVCALSFTMLLDLVVVSRLQHSVAQRQAYDDFRSQLALGTAPIGPMGNDGDLLSVGASVALLEIPSIGVDEVVGEGTTSGVLLDGPGHRRDTPLPGQMGVSVLFGRRAAFGGVFSRINELDAGDEIRVTTGQGVFEFSVIGVRREGDPVPAPLSSGGARLILTTSDGSSFLPNGVLRVDADLDGKAVVGPARLLTSAQLPKREQAMAGDTSTLWALALWLQALIAASLAAMWAWHRWGKAQSWIVFAPVLLLVGLFTWRELALLLPNLM